MARTDDRAMPGFTVLLGPDYSGKSSALAELAASHEIVSVDKEFLPGEHGVVTELKRLLMKEVLPRLDSVYTMDFALSLLRTAAVHVRDRILDSRGDLPVLVDSYHYKILAKYRLLGGTSEPWHGFPEPERVIYLAAKPKTAWRRSGHGARLNRLEHYGKMPDFSSFALFQMRLDKVMRDEVRHLPLTILPEQADVTAAVREIRKAMIPRAA